MGELDGRVAIVTGAGRGIGREHALLLAAEGARVVVNDLGGSSDGGGADSGPAHDVVAEIRAAGGEASANTDDIADWDGAANLIESTIDTYGDLHVLVNNAGILRDRMMANMDIDEWDAVIRVHLRGHFCPSRHAAAYWRTKAKEGVEFDRSLINTSSTSGVLGNFGQANYGAAKAGIAAMTVIASMEMSRYGVRANAIAPAARTRLTEGMVADADPDAFDKGHPGNVSPMVAYLATADCPLNGQLFFVHGGRVQLMQPWTLHERIDKDGRWTIGELREATAPMAEISFPRVDALFD